MAKCKQVIVPIFQQNLKARCYSKVTMSKGWFTKGIVKDLMDDVPDSRLYVDYPEIRVAEGNFINPSQAMQPPEVLWKVISKDNFYTLCMVDIDCPSRSKIEFYSVLSHILNQKSDRMLFVISDNRSLALCSRLFSVTRVIFRKMNKFIQTSAGIF